MSTTAKKLDEGFIRKNSSKVVWVVQMAHTGHNDHWCEEGCKEPFHDLLFAAHFTTLSVDLQLESRRNVFNGKVQLHTEINA